MTKIDIIAPTSKALAPLYQKYDGNVEPGRAFMRLLRSGKVQFGVTLDRTHTLDVHYGREYIWYVPPELTHRELEEFGAEVNKCLAQVLQGICISRDSNNYEERGTLTPKAKEASEKIQEECDRLFGEVESRELGAYVYEAGDYFEGETPDDYGLDENSSDDEIRTEATSLLEHLNENNTMIYGDLFEIMKRWVRSYEYE